MHECVVLLFDRMTGTLPRVAVAYKHRRVCKEKSDNDSAHTHIRSITYRIFFASSEYINLALRFIIHFILCISLFFIFFLLLTLPFFLSQSMYMLE